MSVLVCFHAHPDDEVFNTGGVMRLAADAGHRVVLVTATDGALGEFPEGILTPGESLAERRGLELAESARALGADRVVVLGYADSGMAGTDDNSNPKAFSNVDRDTAARRLADILTEEHADVLTIYDANGGYGHPDHIQVHEVGLRAAEMAGVEKVYESTMNRDHMRELVKHNPAWEQDSSSAPDVEKMGLPAEEITTSVNVVTAMPAKRAAMHAHATQIGDFGPFRDMPDDQLAAVFGTEWFRRVGAPAGMKETSLPL
ncbi:PIG-L family deacetylase [Actinomycetes bacterium M1A6_2h]